CTSRSSPLRSVWQQLPGRLYLSPARTASSWAAAASFLAATTTAPDSLPTTNATEATYVSYFRWTTTQIKSASAARRRWCRPPFLHRLSAGLIRSPRTRRVC
ncbi:hypothetical protein DFH09DRAFT_1353782, partial [Mycena vulgaris]